MLQGPKESDILGRKSILVSIYIDQNETVGTLLFRLKNLTGIPLIDIQNEEGQNFTVLLPYSHEEALRPDITFICPSSRTLEMNGFIDGMTIIVTEVLTHYGLAAISAYND